MIPENTKLSLLFVLLLPLLSIAGVKAEKHRTVKVEFEVVYSLSERVVDPFIIEVYSVTDSAKVKLDRTLWREGNGRLMLEPGKVYKATVAPTSFELETDDGYMANPEYEAVTIDIDLREATKNVKLDQVRIHKKIHRQLGEATVTSSRILFYHKGDTLVYNASEFVLAEGSMIDALIKQLPGVTLKDNGEITVNGRKVDDLLLNGKDLFNGNRQLMLENIGAYTVKDISVYEKNTYSNEILDRKDRHDARYSMDVRLKRQYSTGWNISAEAGYGTHDRYIGKLFAMLFADNVDFSIYGGGNNLSSEFTEESWTPDKMQTGLKTTKSAGINYGIRGHANRWRTSGWVTVKHVTDQSHISTTAENFLPSGSNYQYSFNNSFSKQLNINTTHYINIGVPKKAVFNLQPQFSYEKRQAEGWDISALFNDEIQNVSAVRLRNIYRGYTSLADTLIYRNISQNVVNGHRYNSTVVADGEFNVKSNKMRLTFITSYDSKKENADRLYLINHGTKATPTTQEYRNLKFSPDHTRRLKGLLQFFIDKDWADSRISLEYYFENINTVNTSNVSSAVDWDLSADASAITIAEVQALPGFNPVFSPDLSHRSDLTSNIHHVSASFSHIDPIPISENYAVELYADPLNLNLSERKYHYVSAEVPINLSSTTILPGMTYFVHLMNRNGMMLGANYNLESKDAPMQSMVTLPQTDPMNAYIGNPDLKPYHTHMTGLNLRKPLKDQKYHAMGINARFMQNAITQGYVFNTATGVRYFHPFNVDGNREWNAMYEFFSPFGKGNMFDITTTTTGYYTNSTDLIGTTVETGDFAFDPGDQKRRYVKNLAVEEKLKLNYRFGNHRISAFGEVRLNDYRSKDSGFSDFTSMTARYGASGVFVLPAGFGISTDLNVYTRRGFTDSRLNTSDVVWNARLTKSIMKGSMILAVDAYDMLRQLSNITYTVNAQARTEVVTNVVPAYVLFHVQYRFNRQPKR